VTTLSPADRLLLFRNLVRVRALEEAHVKAVADNKIPGFVHSGLGQEAVGVGACTFLRTDDYLMPTHRGFAHLVAKGVAPALLLAETFGKATGIARGKGGIHFASMEHRAFGISGSVGGVFPIATGQGIAAKHARRGQIVLAFFGDGTAQRGTLHESFNLAALWSLPIVWVCENNQFGLSMPASSGLAPKRVADLAAPYGMPSIVVDGNDVEAVCSAVMDAVEQVRSGTGPRLVELITYRLRGHYEGEPAKYRTPDESLTWKKRDPVVQQRFRLVELGIADETAIASIEAAARAEMDAAIRFADSSPLPKPAEAFEDVLMERA